MRAAGARKYFPVKNPLESKAESESASCVTPCGSFCPTVRSESVIYSGSANLVPSPFGTFLGFLAWSSGVRTHLWSLSSNPDTLAQSAVGNNPLRVVDMALVCLDWFWAVSVRWLVSRPAADLVLFLLFLIDQLVDEWYYLWNHLISVEGVDFIWVR